MSRAKAVAERAALDFYATPGPLAEAICRRVFIEDLQTDPDGYAPALIVEPSAGQGPFIRAAKRLWPHTPITAIDVDPERVGGMLCAGADTAVEADWVRYAPMLDHPKGHVFIIGNPPFREAEAHIRTAMAWMNPGDVLAFLLRINFLGSKNRLAFWEEFPAAWMAPVVPRPSFTGGGTDGTEYAVFAWKKRGVCEGLPPLTRIAPPIRWTP